MYLYLDLLLGVGLVGFFLELLQNSGTEGPKDWTTEGLSRVSN
jgi:hypothetical protein